MSAQNIPILAGLAEVADRYDGYILDLWGTIHDGIEPIPGAIDCLVELKRRGKRVLILSNAPRRSDSIVERIAEMGVTRAHFDDVLSSGEATFMALRDRNDDFHRALGHKCFFMGPPRDDSSIAGLDLQRVDTVEDCDFIANIGTFKRADTIEQYDAILHTAAKHAKPMICANPDLVVLRGAEAELCAGAVAARYEAVGGKVHYHGKPHVPIYAESFRRLGIADRKRIIGVGDALRTDVAGAAAAGIDSIFIASSGIYAERLGIKELAPPPADGLARLYKEDGIAPTYALRIFNW